MLDTDLQKLATQVPDYPLGHLDTDIWAKVAVHESARALSRRIVASTALILVVALIGSVAAGVHSSVLPPPDDLGVFSPHSPWVASNRLDAGQTR